MSDTKEGTPHQEGGLTRGQLLKTALAGAIGVAIGELPQSADAAKEQVQNREAVIQQIVGQEPEVSQEHKEELAKVLRSPAVGVKLAKEYWKQLQHLGEEKLLSGVFEYAHEEGHIVGDPARTVYHVKANPYNDMVNDTHTVNENQSVGNVTEEYLKKENTIRMLLLYPMGDHAPGRELFGIQGNGQISGTFTTQDVHHPDGTVTHEKTFLVTDPHAFLSV